MPDNNYLYIKKFKYSQNPFVEYMVRRVRQNNLNFLMLIVGGTGSGKSYAALKLAEKCDDKFDIERCVFKLKDFMALINRDPPFPKGSVIVFDEIGVEANKKNWYSQTNKMLNYVAQTFRRQNYITIFTTPDASFVDSSLMKLFHCMTTTKGFDRTNNICYVTPLFIETNPISGKIYRKKLRFWQKEGTKCLSKVGLKMPTKELLKLYEQKKKAFNEALNTDIERDLMIEKNSKKQLTPQQQKIYDLVQNETQDAIALKLGVHRSLITKQVGFIRKKGYEVPTHYQQKKEIGGVLNPINAIRALEKQSGGKENADKV